MLGAIEAYAYQVKIGKEIQQNPPKPREPTEDELRDDRNRVKGILPEGAGKYVDFFA